MAKIVNTTAFQISVPIVDAFGNKDSIMMQPGGRVDLPPGSELSVAQPGIVYLPDPASPPSTPPEVVVTE